MCLVVKLNCTERLWTKVSDKAPGGSSGLRYRQDLDQSCFRDQVSSIFISFHQRFVLHIASNHSLEPSKLFRRQHWWGPWFVKIQKIPLTRDHSCAKMQSSPIKICHDVMVQNTSKYCKHLDLVSDRFFPRSQHLAATSPSNKPSNGAGTSGHGSGTGIPGGSSRPWCNNRSWNIIEATNLSRPGWTTKDWTSKDVPPPKVASLHGLPGSTLVTLPPCICRISTHTSFQTDSTWSTSRLCATPFPASRKRWMVDVSKLSRTPWNPLVSNYNSLPGILGKCLLILVLKKLIQDTQLQTPM